MNNIPDQPASIMVTKESPNGDTISIHDGAA